jgi:GntR family transcriptional repressor for pyruvate dehydrogenase complex
MSYHIIIYEMKPIERQRVPYRVAKAILGEVRQGNFKDADRLPAMHELSRTLEVGVSSVREGLNQLPSMGIVRIIQGKGAYLSEKPDLNYFFSPLKEIITVKKQDIINIVEACKVIECETVRFAADRIDAAGIARLL